MRCHSEGVGPGRIAPVPGCLTGPSPAASNPAGCNATSLQDLQATLWAVAPRCSRHCNRPAIAPSKPSSSRSYSPASHAPLAPLPPARLTPADMARLNKELSDLEPIVEAMHTLRAKRSEVCAGTPGRPERRVPLHSGGRAPAAGHSEPAFRASVPPRCLNSAPAGLGWPTTMCPQLAPTCRLCRCAAPQRRARLACSWRGCRRCWRMPGRARRCGAWRGRSVRRCWRRRAGRAAAGA